jgi:hypothetical protein
MSDTSIRTPLLANQVHGDLRFSLLIRLFRQAFGFSLGFEFLMILNFIIYGILDARAWEDIVTGKQFSPRN